MMIKILGCGASGGVPLITGEWGECNPLNPKNRRRRSSIAIEEKNITLLIDTSPDLREQCLAAHIKNITGVLYTHEHGDHSHGIDDLRSFLYHNKIPIPVYGNRETINLLKARFGYAFPSKQNLSVPHIYRPFVTDHIIEGPFQIADILITPFYQGHGFSLSIGYRIGKIAYSTDVVTLDEDAFKALEGIDTWIVDCIAMDPRPTHSHLAQTLEWIKRVKPRRAYLTHMSHHLDYDQLRKILPQNIEPAYDGLVIEV